MPIVSWYFFCCELCTGAWGKKGGKEESCVCDLILLFSLLLVTFLQSLLLEGASYFSRIQGWSLRGALRELFVCGCLRLSVRGKRREGRWSCGKACTVFDQWGAESQRDAMERSVFCDRGEGSLLRPSRCLSQNTCVDTVTMHSHKSFLSLSPFPVSAGGSVLDLECNLWSRWSKSPVIYFPIHLRCGTVCARVQDDSGVLARADKWRPLKASLSTLPKMPSRGGIHYCVTCGDRAHHQNTCDVMMFYLTACAPWQRQATQSLGLVQFLS